VVKTIGKTHTTIDLEDLKRLQHEDPRLGPIIQKLKQSRKQQEGSDLYHLGVLYHLDEDGKQTIHIPRSLIRIAIELCHDVPLSGHMGPERTCKLLAERYHFANMRRQVEEYIKECPSCNEHKGNLPSTAHMHSYPVPQRPWQRTGMDILGPFPKTPQGNKYILVFTDHLTRYNEMIATPDQTSPTVARALVERVISRHSSPKVLISDNALGFTSSVFKTVCEICKIDKVQIVPYHPQANGLVERQNRKILDVLRHLVTQQQTNWDTCIPLVQMAVNNGYNVSVGDTPHFLLHHYEKDMPYDLPLTKLGENITDIPREELAKRSFKIFDIVRERLYHRNRETREYQHLETPKPREIIVGTRCYLKAVRPPGVGRKLFKKWDGPFRIMKDFGKNRFEILDLRNKKSKLVHADNLKLVPEQCLDPLELPAPWEPFPRLRQTITDSPNPGISNAETDAEKDLHIVLNPSPKNPVTPPTSPPLDSSSPQGNSPSSFDPFSSPGVTTSETSSGFSGFETPPHSFRPPPPPLNFSPPSPIDDLKRDPTYRPSISQSADNFETSDGRPPLPPRKGRPTLQRPPRVPSEPHYHLRKDGPPEQQN